MRNINTTMCHAPSIMGCEGSRSRMFPCKEESVQRLPVYCFQRFWSPKQCKRNKGRIVLGREAKDGRHGPQSRQDGVIIIERFAHAHEHDVANAREARGVYHLLKISPLAMLALMPSVPVAQNEYAI
ncbi:hypothetical protein PsorP6_008142 [Peronosclerospora sorghi]|uniref:Uncharacterized protein n=1 Tax=Peronosclerospora sorghi TaxID=230839 RepID=A0ACC0WB65_9STRA|nr:hypothetical protein PsorP6_008142 [Peronosclerospora sorghi]